MKSKVLLLIVCMVTYNAIAQTSNPFKAINKKAKIITLSDGKYVESFDDEVYQRVGSVIIDTRTKKIAQFINSDSLITLASDNTTASRWLSLDPLAKKYPSTSPYTFCSNNPISFKDPDGADIVYFNMAGQEVNRTGSKTQFQTFVGSAGNWQEAGMPKVIKGFELPVYQKHDYSIAANTFIFNQSKNAGSLDFHTEGGNTPSATVQKGVPDLDPTLVKAIVMQETHMGTDKGGFRNGNVDIMQANVTGDWGKGWKSQFGLEEGASTNSPGQSIQAGIGELYIKGFKNGSTPVTNSKGKITGYDMKWTGGEDWSNAAKNYNGGGAAKHGQTYDVPQKVNNAQDAKPNNY